MSVRGTNTAKNGEKTVLDSTVTATVSLAAEGRTDFDIKLIKHGVRFLLGHCAGRRTHRGR